MAIGAYKKLFWLMIVGRVIFGLGGENMSVGQSAIVSKWFKGKELNMALGLNISIARLGSVINGLTVLGLYNSSPDGNLGLPFLVGFFICAFSFGTALAIACIDRHADKVDGTTDAVTSEEEKFKWGDLLKFNLSFWLIAISCVLTYMVIFPFIQNLTNMLETKYGLDESTAGAIFGIPYIISACTSPFLGFMIDRKGRRVLLVIISGVLLLISHLITMFLPGC